MNKNIFTFLMVGMAACAVSTSCSKDDGDGDSGAPGAPAGALVSGNEAVDAAVRDLRLTAAGPFLYEYDENGCLRKILNMYDDDDESWEASVSGNVIKTTYKAEWTEGYREETGTFNIVNNHIVSASINTTLSDEDETSSENTTMKYSYNAFGQLSSCEYSSSWTGTEYGERFSGSANCVVTRTYSSDNRLLSEELAITYKGDDPGTEKMKITYEYDSAYPNLFYQYAPDDNIEDRSSGGAFRLVGLWGKASSFLPSGCVEECVEEYDDEVFTDKTHVLFSYTFNENGTLKSVSLYSSNGGSSLQYDYSYSDVGTRATMEKPVSGAEKRPFVPSFLRKHHGRRHHANPVNRM